MIKALIVDDESRLAASLQTMLQRFCPQLRIMGVAYHADEAVAAIIAYKPELVFLDISMPGKNAFTMLEELGKIDFEIIFTTAHSSYMLQAFKYSAVDYLLKPVDEDELVSAVDRASQRIRKNDLRQNIETLRYNLQKTISPSDQKLCLATLNGFQVIGMQDIVYCEAEGSYTNFFLASGKYICASRPLIDYETLLGDGFFLRVHKSTLINLNHVVAYSKGEGGTVTMSNQKELEISRRKKDFFMAKMKELFRF